jgi:hypothetical protein
MVTDFAEISNFQASFLKNVMQQYGDCMKYLALMVMVVIINKLLKLDM